MHANPVESQGFDKGQLLDHLAFRFVGHPGMRQVALFQDDSKIDGVQVETETVPLGLADAIGGVGFHQIDFLPTFIEIEFDLE